MTTDAARRSWGGARPLGAAPAGAIAMLSVSLSVALVGPLGVQLERSLGIDSEYLGILVALYFAGWVAASPVASALSRRFGPLAVVRTTTIGGGLLLVGMTVLSNHAWHLAALMPVSGAAAGIAQPSINAYLASSLPARKLGGAMGLKQAVSPASSLLAGLAVPTIALTVGWRWAFLVATLPALVTLALLERETVERAPRSEQPAPSALPPLRALVLLMLGSGLATSYASTVLTFVVVSAVRTGLRPAAAGILVAVVSSVAVAVRVGLGAVANRLISRPFTWVTAMVLSGAAGCGLLAVGTSQHLLAVFVLGAVIAVGIGWGWSGLFYLGVVGSNRGSEAKATSIVQVGGGAGTALGPLIFGVVASSVSFTAVWVGAACVGVVAGLAMITGAHLVSARR
jgi:cyanate permease